MSFDIHARSRDLTEQRPQLRKGRYRPAGKNPVFAPGPEVGSRKLVGSNSKPTAKAQATTGTGSGDSAGVSKPPVVRSFHFTLLSFLVASLSFRTIHSLSQKMMMVADAAFRALGNVVSRELYRPVN